MRIDELFGVFKNNTAYDKAQAQRAQAKKNASSQSTKDDEEETDDKEDGEDDKKPFNHQQKRPEKRSNSTQGTQPTRGHQDRK